MRISISCKVFASLAATLVTALGATLQAEMIGRNAFGPNAKVEGFEQFAQSQTLLSIPLTFPSGVRLVQPDPNYGIDFGVYGIGTSGFYGGATPPDGVGYLAQANPGLFTGPMVFDFPTPQLRVGGFIATSIPGSPPSAVTMSVYSSTGTLLESVSINGILPQNWANDFVGIERAEGIASVSFAGVDTSGVFRLDDLTFEAIPEPATIPGLLIMLLFVRCFDRKPQFLSRHS